MGCVHKSSYAAPAGAGHFESAGSGQRSRPRRLRRRGFEDAREARRRDRRPFHRRWGPWAGSSPDGPERRRRQRVRPLRIPVDTPAGQ